MARTQAATADAYLAELRPEQRSVIAGVRELIRQHLPAGYNEAVRWGMITYEIPLERYANTYNRQPLCYVGLAAHKSYCTLYLMSVYENSDREKRLEQAFRKAGKKFDMGKSCLRFRSLNDLELDAIAKLVGSTTPDQFIADYESTRRKPTTESRTL